MGKLATIFCLVLLVGAVMSATVSTRRPWTRPTDPTHTPGCKNHGYPCTSRRECCGQMQCNSREGVCQAIITADELNAAREKILKRRGPDN